MFSQYQLVVSGSIVVVYGGLTHKAPTTALKGKHTMADPTLLKRTFPNDPNAVTNTNTQSKRVTGTISGESIVSTGAGNEIDLGTIDIGSLGAVVNCIICVNANGGFTAMDDLRLWHSSDGFVTSNVEFVALSQDGTPTNTETIVASSDETDYTEANIPKTLPGSNNLWRADDDTQTSTDITTPATPTDDAFMFALFSNIIAGETSGTYKGTDSGFEQQFSIRFSFS